VVSRHGGPAALELRELSAPTPGRGEIAVDVTASGVNFIDVYQREGAYQVTLPYVPGSEGSGVISMIGEGVEGWAVGDRVAWSSGVPGSYAEVAVIPADRAVAVPEGTPMEAAAGILLQGMTAHYLCHSTYRIQSGETAVVHAAAGGTGLLLTQMIKRAGGRVIATVSGPQKEQLARQAGADDVIGYDGFADRVLELTGGVGVEVVYDGVGKATFDDGLRCLRPRGLMVLFGAAGGPVDPVDPMRLARAGAVYLTRPLLIPYYLTGRDELLWRAGDVLEWLGDGSLSLHIGGRYPLADAAQAHHDLQSRGSTGKLILVR
jgi:NADPH2:quinone reductase